MSTEEKGQVRLAPVKNEGELLQALAIREIVFIEEQHVPEGIERDAEDARAYHVLAFQGGHAIGTGRLVMLAEGPHGEPGRWAQIGRMAVLQAARKAGVGSMLLRALETEADAPRGDRRSCSTRSSTRSSSTGSTATTPSASSSKRPASRTSRCRSSVNANIAGRGR